jgi:hypothetical protein
MIILPKKNSTVNKLKIVYQQEYEDKYIMNGLVKIGNYIFLIDRVVRGILVIENDTVSDGYFLSIFPEYETENRYLYKGVSFKEHLIGIGLVATESINETV